jgi:hypothetical protein
MSGLRTVIGTIAHMGAEDAVAAVSAAKKAWNTGAIYAHKISINKLSRS